LGTVGKKVVNEGGLSGDPRKWGTHDKAYVNWAEKKGGHCVGRNTQEADL